MSFKIDLDLDVVKEKLHAATEAGLRVGVEYLRTEANRRVPHDEGVLERSSRASVDGLKGAVSYDTPYAVRQHEDMSFHHDGKGEAKWLENTFTTEKATAGRVVANTIKRELGT